MKMRNPWIIAHRGARREAPENTRAAFDAAMAYPIDGIECDVQQTNDGELVLFHDRTLQRIDGRRQAIADHSAAQLRQLDWGSWFADRFGGEPLCTLDELLRRYASRVRLFIEIKTTPRDRATGRSMELLQQVLRLLDARVPVAFRRQIYILSFDVALLSHGVREQSQWHYVWNCEKADAPLDQSHDLYGKDIGICLAIRSLTPAIGVDIRAHYRQLFTYTCNHRHQVDVAMAAGVHGIITDRPDWLTKAKRIGD